MNKTETEIKLEVMEYLKLRGIPCNRRQAGIIQKGARWIHMGKSGWADITVVLPPNGRYLGVEVKRPGEELSGIQEKVKYDIERAGGKVIVVHSVEELIKKLNAVQPTQMSGAR